jgi:hypothetical protein
LKKSQSAHPREKRDQNDENMTVFANFLQNSASDLEKIDGTLVRHGASVEKQCLTVIKLCSIRGSHAWKFERIYF